MSHGRHGLSRRAPMDFPARAESPPLSDCMASCDDRLRPLFLIAKIALIAARLLASLDFTSAIQYMINSRPKTYRRQNVK